MLQAGANPQAYAEGILKICELYLASPLACVAGVTGANLQRRVLAILSGRIAPGLTFTRKVLLAAAGTAALVAPFVIGMISTRPVRAQSSAAASPKFGVASVKPSDPRSHGVASSGDPSRFTIHNVMIRFLISLAYDVKDFRIPAGPHWLDSDRYDIEATYGAYPPERRGRLTLMTIQSDPQVRLMLQALLWTASIWRSGTRLRNYRRTH